MIAGMLAAELRMQILGMLPTGSAFPISAASLAEDLGISERLVEACLADSEIAGYLIVRVPASYFIAGPSTVHADGEPSATPDPTSGIHGSEPARQRGTDDRPLPAGGPDSPAGKLDSGGADLGAEASFGEGESQSPRSSIDTAGLDWSDRVGRGPSVFDAADAVWTSPNGLTFSHIITDAGTVYELQPDGSWEMIVE